MLEHLLPVPNNMFRIDNWRFDPVLVDKVSQRLLAHDLHERAVVTITPKEIKGVVDQPVLPAGRQVRLQLREVGPTLMNNHHFAVDDSLAGDVEGVGDGREAISPVEPVARVDLALAIVDVDLDTVAVEFDFVNPLVALGAFGFKVASWGLMNPGISGLLRTTQLTRRTRRPPRGGAVSRAS